MMKYALVAVAALAAVGMVGTAARADTTVNDSTVGMGGFMPGHGDPQNNFTVVTSTDGLIQLGLSAQPRFSGPAVTDNGTGTFFAFTGSNKSGSGLVGAVWDFDYSIEDSSGGTIAGDLSNVMITVTNSESVTGVVNPFGPEITDNTPPGSSVEAQNSENILFNIFNSPTSFDANQPDDYTITLSGLYKGATISDTIHVDVVATPLPSAAGMGLLLVGGLGVMGLLKKRFAAA